MLSTVYVSRDIQEAVDNVKHVNMRINIDLNTV